MTDTPPNADFIRQLIRADLAEGRHAQIRTRFPPEPNGYLHLGHGKSICLNFGVAQEFGGTCNLRFDDTNPAKEDQLYVDAIAEDVRWLGFQWHQRLHASDYFEVFYRCALKLIAQGDAYVCDLSADEVRAYRGTLTEAGRPSPYRERSAAQNLELFEQMRAGAYADGAKTLRARIDMASGNINLRDPALYRIRHLSHQHTGDAWCIYPMYDYAHALSDAIEGITHSLCTLEFEDHRPLYDWCIERCDVAGDSSLLEALQQRGLGLSPSVPRQIEFARGNLDYTVMSKRKLTQLVAEGLVSGWDDPRMPTLAGARRRGYTPAAIRLFWQRAGVSKQQSVIEYGVLEGCVREDLDLNAERRLAVLEPLALDLVNLPTDAMLVATMANHPKDPARGERSLATGAELWIEREDFMEQPPKGYYRLVPGGEVRLKGLGIVRCVGVEHDNHGQVCRVRAELDHTSRPGQAGADRKVKGTIHWLSRTHAAPAEFRLYDRLFTEANPDPDEESGRSYRDYLNPGSIRILHGMVETSALLAEPESRFQFERVGFFIADRHDHQPGNRAVYNRIVPLRDSWAKAQAGAG